MKLSPTCCEPRFPAGAEPAPGQPQGWGAAGSSRGKEQNARLLREAQFSLGNVGMEPGHAVLISQCWHH